MPDTVAYSMGPVLSFAFISVLLLAGHVVRAKVRLLRVIFLPASCVGGAVGCALVNVLGMWEGPAGYMHSELLLGWAEVPSFLTNVAFATLVLGAELPSPAEVWRISGPQLAFAQLLSFGQYALVSLASAAVLGPYFGTPALFAVVVPMSFEGGHGVIAGQQAGFKRFAYAEGYELGMIGATVSLLGGTMIGCALVNWAAFNGLLARQHRVQGQKVRTNVSADASVDISSSAFNGCYPLSARPSAGKQTVATSSLDSLALHMSMIGLVLGIAAALKIAVAEAEQLAEWSGELQLFSSLPLFLYAMLSALLVQICLERLGPDTVVPLDRPTCERLCGMSMDYLIVAAIATLEFDALAAAAAPFAIGCGLAFAWAVLVFFALGRFLPDFWVERAITEVGLSLGATATAMLMLRMVDPENETPVLRAFCYKQLVHCSIVGGGVFTASTLQITHHLGAWGLCAISSCGAAGWLLVLVFGFRNRPRTHTHAHAARDAEHDASKRLLG